MLKNEKGFTLIEVVVSLVLLSLLFIIMMIALPQMTNFSTKTSTKLMTMNQAKIHLQELKDQPNALATYTERDGARFCKMNEKNQRVCVTYDKETTKAYGIMEVLIQVEKEGKISSESTGFVKIRGVANEK